MALYDQWQKRSLFKHQNKYKCILHINWCHLFLIIVFVHSFQHITSNLRGPTLVSCICMYSKKVEREVVESVNNVEKKGVWYYIRSLPVIRRTLTLLFLPNAISYFNKIFLSRLVWESRSVLTLFLFYSKII